MFYGSVQLRLGVRCIAGISFLLLCISVAFAESNPEPQPEQNLEQKPEQQDVSLVGARIFTERCVLCHGNYGAGDGFLPLVIAGYPDTNLLQSKKNGHFRELQSKVTWGGTRGDINDKSPPWVGELKLSELQAVAQFISSLRDNPKQAWRLLDKYLENKPVTVETGRLVYQTRCVSCHGPSGRGNGPMSVIVNNPPPSNLVMSRMTRLDIERIITLGGDALGRSGQMPAWKNELSKVQINSVTAYVEQLKIVR